MTSTDLPPWHVAAQKDVGLREIVGSKDEPRIVAFFAKAGAPGVKDDETAWCAAFVGAKLAEAGVRGTGLLNARSYLDWGQPLTKPAPGCVVIFKRGSSSWQGHVAFYVGDAGSQISVLGGNQANRVSVARYAKSSVLGYRWPQGYALPLGGPAKPAAAPGQRLQIGDKSPSVGDWQRGLNALRIATPRLKEDDDFGAATKRATLAFQKKFQLAPDGVVDGPDWITLDTKLEQLG